LSMVGGERSVVYWSNTVELSVACIKRSRTVEPQDEGKCVSARGRMGINGRRPGRRLVSLEWWTTKECGELWCVSPTSL
jgi:hypothetical protein